MAKCAKSFYRPGSTGSRLLALISTLGLLSAARLSAIEDPPNCNPANGGSGVLVQAGLNFNLAQAHVGDIVPVFPSLGMENNACRGVGNGSVYISTGKFVDYLINARLDPGVLISCPAGGLCAPGPYNLTITPQLVGAGVGTQLGFVPGVPRTVRIVSVNTGRVSTGTPTDQFASRVTASIAIVTPCIQVFKFCPTNCTPAGSSIDFTGYVTNCGDIRLTDVTVVDNRTPTLLTSEGLPLFHPLLMEPGQAVAFKGSFWPTLAEICAGSATNTITVRGTDITIFGGIGGPRASVTNSTTGSCAICITPCLQVTKNCDPVTICLPNTLGGSVSNCGNIGLTNIVIADDLFVTLATIASVAPGETQYYSALVTNSLPNLVTASGSTLCGLPVTARATTNTCQVPEAPCIQVAKNCDTVTIDSSRKLSGVVANCGNVALTNITIVDNLYGALATIPSLGFGQSQNYSALVTNDTCGTFTNFVTASGSTFCGVPVEASSANTCTPCIRVTKNCDTAVIGSPNTVYGSVFNCGNITLTNIVIVDNLYGTLATIPSVAPGRSEFYSARVTNNSCGSFPNFVIASGSTLCGLPMTASAANTCVVMTEGISPCISVTKNCDTVAVGSPNTVSGSVFNCANITLTNVVIADNLNGVIATIPSLPPFERQNYSACGSVPNFVTASGSTPCGVPVSARATNTCVAAENPCLQVTKICDTVTIGLGNTVSGVVYNCGSITLTNILIVDDLYGTLTTFASLSPFASRSYSKLVTNATCGNFPSSVTATGRSPCGMQVSATVPNTCVVACPP